MKKHILFILVLFALLNPVFASEDIYIEENVSSTTIAEGFDKLWKDLWILSEINIKTM